MQGKFGRPESVTLTSKTNSALLGLTQLIFSCPRVIVGLHSPLPIPREGQRQQNSDMQSPKRGREEERVEWSGVVERLARFTHPKPPIGWPVHGRGHRGEGTVHHRI